MTMGRQFESLISEAPGFLSRRNAIALIAMAAGSVATLELAVAAAPPRHVGNVAGNVVNAGSIVVNGGVAVNVAAGDTPEQVVGALNAEAAGTYTVSIQSGAIAIESLLDQLDVQGTAATLADLGLTAGTYGPVAGSSEGFRPFTAGDGDDADLKVAVLMADAAALEEAVFVDKLAEVKAAKIVVAEAARAEAITALAKQNIEVR
jgi:hypothetical protein